MWFLDFFLIFVIAVIVVMFIQNHYGEVEYVRSNIDGRAYLVQRLPNAQEAADYLADINKRLVRVVRHLYAKHSDNPDVERLYLNYNPENVSEGSADSGYTSYSVNKGEKLILCIRQNDEKKTFVDKNVVMYVALHELSHLMTKEVGHTDTFWSNFKFILQEAIDIGEYRKVNFNDNPKDYCGIKISSSII